MIILDTNVISELMKMPPDQAVMQCLASYPANELYTTTITQAEVLFGIMLLPSGKRRSGFESAANAMFNNEFAGRILPFGAEAVHPYAEIAAARQLAGRPIAHFDAQIAAIAKSIGAVILTGNEKDFAHCAVKIINPWKMSKH